MALILITLASLLSAIFNAAFATGGIYLLIALTASILPASEAIPLIPMFASGSLIGRCIFFREHIHWPMVRLFSAGAIIGAFLGARVFTSMSDTIISTLLAFSILALLWLPQTKKLSPNISHPMFYVGITHTFISTLVGAGGVLQTIMIRTSLTKLEITAILAACTSVMEVFKVTGYIAHGFSYFPYIPHILLAILAGLVGTRIGSWLAIYIDEKSFRPIFKAIISLVAIQLLVKTWLFG